MKRFLLVIPAWLLMAAALFFVIIKKRAETKPPENSRTSFAGQASLDLQPGTMPTGATSKKPRSAAGGGKAEASGPDRRDEVLREIESAVISYSPEGVKPIASHLLDSDPMLRESARQGLVQLGEPASIPLLREAARSLDGTESKACMDAAAFLELPSWSDTEEARAASAELSKPSNEP